ncbi:MAG: hypothetical protein LN568_06555 [Rickettsia endosymbiont of Pseudomimeciton antennatum]|nr:hypothetical protein [Rickettsia endosymbiont of Pseudomimeciton antennatum]
MSKNQEDNATSTSKIYEEFLASLENSRAKLERKSVEEIKKLSTLELAKYFCNIHLLIKYYYSFSSEEREQNSYDYLKQHTKPDIDKFIATFDTLKANILQLPYDPNSQNLFPAWTGSMTFCLNKLQNLTPENLENMFKEMQGTFEKIVADFRQLLYTPSLKSSLNDAVAKLTEEDKASKKELEVTLLHKCHLQIEDVPQVPTTGSSSDLEDDDLA